jgi:VanZ family protein
MKKIIFNKKTALWCVRIILTLLCILMIGWIFSNSMKNAVESGQQSSQVTEGVQDVIETIKPDVSLGGETKEEDFNILHQFVRNFAHFGEFALLCALVTWCVLSYTHVKGFFAIPFPLCVGVAFMDEYIQTFSEGRAQEFADVLTDGFGALSGFAFALLTIWIGWLIYRSIKRKRAVLAEQVREID